MMSGLDELKDGRVLVRIKSRRGTGTRDQDEVTVQATYDDVGQATVESDQLNKILRQRMSALREMNDPSEELDRFELPPSSESEISKIYLGRGSELSGWIPVNEQAMFEQIAPLINESIVQDDNTQSVKVNFSDDVPLSGWKEVDTTIVTEQIEPLIQKYRTD